VDAAAIWHRAPAPDGNQVRVARPEAAGATRNRATPSLSCWMPGNGIISEDAARRIYGVAISHDGRSIDVGATRKLQGG